MSLSLGNEYKVCSHDLKLLDMPELARINPDEATRIIFTLKMSRNRLVSYFISFELEEIKLLKKKDKEKKTENHTIVTVYILKKLRNCSTRHPPLTSSNMADSQLQEELVRFFSLVSDQWV